MNQNKKNRFSSLKPKHFLIFGGVIISAVVALLYFNNLSKAEKSVVTSKAIPNQSPTYLPAQGKILMTSQNLLLNETL